MSGCDLVEEEKSCVICGVGLTTEEQTTGEGVCEACIENEGQADYDAMMCDRETMWEMEAVE